MNGRRQLLDTALLLFAERGVSATSMRDLAKGAGLSVAAAYHHFDSKQALLQALFEEQFQNAIWMERTQVVTAAAELRQLPRSAALAAIIEGALDRLDEHADFVRLVHVEVLHGDPDAAAVGLKMWREWSTIVRMFVVEAALATGDGIDRLTQMLQLATWGAFLQPSRGKPSSRRRRREALELAAAL